jgi:DNA-directed RNA polymerase specialized sigma24 family protein
MQHTAVLDSDLHSQLGADHQAAADGNQTGAEPTASELLARASVGDRAAWNHLVDRHSGLVWAVARAHGLTPAAAAEASQLTWLLLAQHLGSLQQHADRLGEWLAATTRRQSQRLRQLRRHAGAAAGEPDLAARSGPTPAAAVGLAAGEGKAGPWHAVAVLPERCHPLVRLLMVEPPLGDDELAAALGIPIDHIGRARARCLACLRRATTAGGPPERPVGAGRPAAAGCHAQGEHPCTTSMPG